MSASALFVLLCSQEHEKIQMAAMVASVAAVSERPVQVFVSMSAIYVFRREVAGERYSGGPFSQEMKNKNVPDALDLFEQGKMLGDLKILPCSMALDVSGLTMEDFVEGLFDEPAGLTKFLSDAEAGQLIVL